MEGKDNKAFEPISDPPSVELPDVKSKSVEEGKNKKAFEPIADLPTVKLPDVESKSVKSDYDEEEEGPQRAMWGSQLEFLMSCIATSVGLGNIWRFPFVAYQNGGGAFLIPYIIVLFLIGKPMYYLECVLGQFSSRNSIKVWSLSPGFKGTGYAQALGCTYVLSYYVSIIALCLYYLVMSFQAELPWSVCRDEPGWENCVPSDLSTYNGSTSDGTSISSAELYFLQSVLQQVPSLENGIGLPIWYLVIPLFVAWLIIFGIVAAGVRSSGKASYFLALFPYVVMLILFISVMTLSGSGDGILFFLTPQWEKLIQLDVWYSAVTQVFFSLSVCQGPIIMFSSYNDFKQNIYRDSMIVTTLDTFTSLFSGMTIFGILGNLAYELNEPIANVVGSGGTGLAFISYPDAIAKTPLPQLFSVLFFVMMSVLGVGSAVALISTLNTVLLDAFPRVKTIYMSAFSCILGFGLGLFYTTPGGQYILDLVDYYGGTFLILFTAIVEIIGVMWIYGLEKFCLDIEFMLNIKVSFYWRFCWGIITPVMMVVVFGYAMQTLDALLFGGEPYPQAGYAAGYAMLFVGIALVPLFMIIAMIKNRGGSFVEVLKKTFNPKHSWGPSSPKAKREWIKFKEEAKIIRKEKNPSPYNIKHIWYILIGSYRRNVKTI